MHRLSLSRRTLLQSVAALGLGLAVPMVRAAPNTVGTRLICVGGALTEIVYALGAQHLLVGVDTTSQFPPAAQQLAQVGYERLLSTEGILSLAPSAILASEDAGPPIVLRKLAAAGVPIHRLAAHHRFEGVISRIQQIGQLTGRSTHAAQLIATMQSSWQDIGAKKMLIQAPPCRVLFILTTAPGQTMAAGQRTAADAMLTYAGAINAMTGFQGYKPLTPEAVVAARPDVLLLTTQGFDACGGKEGVLHLPGVSQTPAGRQKRIVTQEALLLLGFGPRLPKAVTQLITQLHTAS